MKRNIYTIGETLFDIIFKNGQPQAGKAGGAMLNSSVSLGRIGLPVHLLSEYGDDDIGRIIDDFLKSNGVSTLFADHFKDGNTALAIATLNEKNDASYTFYKNYPSRRLEIDFPVIVKDDIILCGSIFAITREIRQKFVSFVTGASENGAVVLYDPNFRKAHASELDELRPMIVENIQMASIIRGSDEDFQNIFGASTPEKAWDIIKKYCNCMVYTASSEGVYVRTTNFEGKFTVRKIKPVSTIGAGDNFNAGMIAAIYRNGISRDQLAVMGEDLWSKVISSGVDFASDVCMSYENYISDEFAIKLK
ncbi:MAG TPA: carbohydrate kinase [Bacteroidales bacterium]|jgi:fructokinase|nr:carbohydrate kinase [Bacteroidales bacterium]HBZ19873.1 carbohydrate kinase [Bacteroidales bacterium]